MIYFIRYSSVFPPPFATIVIFFIFYNLLFVYFLILTFHHMLSELQGLKAPPLAQACSLCPIQNSQFSPHPTCPIRPTCPTRLTCPSPLSLPIPPTSRILPTRPTCLTCPTRPKIQNSEFTIHKFPSHYLEHIIGFKNSYLYVR